MDKYIKVGDLKEFYEPYSNRGLKIPVDVILANIDDMPAADVVKARYGHWNRIDIGFYECSECKHRKEFYYRTEFCPKCGADMRDKVTK